MWTINQVGFWAIIKCRDYNHTSFFFPFCNTRAFLFNCLAISPSAYLHSYKLDATYLILLIIYLFVLCSLFQRRGSLQSCTRGNTRLVLYTMIWSRRRWNLQNGEQKASLLKLKLKPSMDGDLEKTCFSFFFSFLFSLPVIFWIGVWNIRSHKSLLQDVTNLPEFQSCFNSWEL